MRKLGGGKGAILCLVGPPGVGKTSLVRSIATAIGRKFTALSCAGLSDGTELRGHNRGWRGAQPARLLREFVRTGAKNPVLILDEIDKLSRISSSLPSSRETPSDPFGRPSFRPEDLARARPSELACSRLDVATRGLSKRRARKSRDPLLQSRSRNHLDTAPPPWSRERLLEPPDFVHNLREALEVPADLLPKNLRRLLTVDDEPVVRIAI